MTRSPMICLLITIGVQSFGLTAGSSMDPQQPVDFACVNNVEQTKFNYIVLGRSNSTNEIVDKMIATHKKVNLHFLGYETELQNMNGYFEAAKEFMETSKVAVCIAQYAYQSSIDSDYTWYRDVLKYRLDFVADVVVNLIVVINEYKKIALNNIFLSGFCLGGNVASMVGEKVKDRFFGKPKSQIGMLTAIDPPLIGVVGKGLPRVNKRNAQFVLGIHTSKHGYKRSFGHIDIYVNNRDQPGCENDPHCSHLAGNELFKFIISKSKLLPSIKGNPVAFKDPKCATKMCKEGESDHLVISLTDKIASPEMHGNYYMKTEAIFGKDSK